MIEPDLDDAEGDDPEIAAGGDADQKSNATADETPSENQQVNTEATATRLVTSYGHHDATSGQPYTSIFTSLYLFKLLSLQSFALKT